MLQFVKADERFAIGLEVEYGKPGVSDAFDHVSVSITQGRRTKRTRYPSLDTAARKYHQVIGEQLDAGFTLEVDGVSVTTTAQAELKSFPELEQRIEDRGDDADWSALAHAWSEAGDPRGDCILGESGLVGLDDVAQYLRRKAQVERSRRIRNAHIWGLLGRDAYRLRATFRKGLVEHFLLPDEICAPGRPTKDLVASALASPFARFVRELHVVRGNADELARVIGASPRADRVTLTTFRYP